METKIFVLLSILLLSNIVFAQGAFNVEIEVPETYQTMPAGENIWFIIKVANLANQNRMDITLKYEILDSNKELKAMKSETVAIETQASFVNKLKVPEYLEDGLYFLKITLISSLGDSEGETSFMVTHEEPEAWGVIKFSLFDIVIEIPDKYKKVYPGNELLSTIKLVNLGSSGRIDVFLDYWITDSEQNLMLERKETVAVETQSSFVRSFDIPEDAKPGKYYLNAKVTYANGLEAATTHSFEVIKREFIDESILFWIIIASCLIIAFYVIFKSKPIIKKLQERAKIARIVRKRMGKK